MIHDSGNRIFLLKACATILSRKLHPYDLRYKLLTYDALTTQNTEVQQGDDERNAAAEISCMHRLTLHSLGAGRFNLDSNAKDQMTPFPKRNEMPRKDL